MFEMGTITEVEYEVVELVELVVTNDPIEKLFERVGVRVEEDDLSDFVTTDAEYRASITAPVKITLEIIKSTFPTGMRKFAEKLCADKKQLAHLRQVLFLLDSEKGRELFVDFNQCLYVQGTVRIDSEDNFSGKMIPCIVTTNPHRVCWNPEHGYNKYRTDRFFTYSD